MRGEHPDSFSPDAATCIARGESFNGVNAFCRLMNAWGNCLQMGCYVRPDGSLCELDNSAEAMAKRVRQMKRQEGKS